MCPHIRCTHSSLITHAPGRSSPPIRPSPTHTPTPRIFFVCRFPVWFAIVRGRPPRPDRARPCPSHLLLASSSSPSPCLIRQSSPSPGRESTISRVPYRARRQRRRAQRRARCRGSVRRAHAGFEQSKQGAREVVIAAAYTAAHSGGFTSGMRRWRQSR